MNKILLALYEPYNPINPRLNVPASGDALTLPRAMDILTAVGNYLIIFSVIFAVIAIVWGGIQYMFSPDKAEAAKSRIKNGIIGTAVVLGVGLIIKTIVSIITGCFFGSTFFGLLCR